MNNRTLGLVFLWGCVGVVVATVMLAIVERAPVVARFMPLVLVACLVFGVAGIWLTYRVPKPRSDDRCPPSDPTRETSSNSTPEDSDRPSN